jgi:hypothetical protein
MLPLCVIRLKASVSILCCVLPAVIKGNHKCARSKTKQNLLKHYLNKKYHFETKQMKI